MWVCVVKLVTILIIQWLITIEIMIAITKNAYAGTCLRICTNYVQFWMVTWQIIQVGFSMLIAINITFIDILYLLFIVARSIWLVKNSINVYIIPLKILFCLQQNMKVYLEDAYTTSLNRSYHFEPNDSPFWAKFTKGKGKYHIREVTWQFMNIFMNGWAYDPVTLKVL